MTEQNDFLKNYQKFLKISSLSYMELFGSLVLNYFRAYEFHDNLQEQNFDNDAVALEVRILEYASAAVDVDVDVGVEVDVGVKSEIVDFD